MNANPKVGTPLRGVRRVWRLERSGGAHVYVSSGAGKGICPLPQAFAARCQAHPAWQ